MINEHEILDINTNIMDNSDISTIKQGQFCKFSTPLSSSLLRRLPVPTYTTILLTSTTTILLCRCPHHRTIHPQPPLSSLQLICSDLHPLRHRWKISSSPSHRRQTAQITTTIRWWPSMQHCLPFIFPTDLQTCKWRRQWNNDWQTDLRRREKRTTGDAVVVVVMAVFLRSEFWRKTIEEEGDGGYSQRERERERGKGKKRCIQQQ